jgi:hypothetical protein
MNNPSLFTTKEISIKAKELISSTIGESVRDGIELLLKNDIPFDTEPPADPNIIDSGDLLRLGLNILADSPLDALSLTVGAKTLDVRKAYKKLALKYHPGNHHLNNI